MSEEVLLSIEAYHPSYGYGEIELTLHVDLYYEPEDRSVGIMSDGFSLDDWDILKAVFYSDIHADGTEIPKDIAEQLIPEDEWERLLKEAESKAEEQVRAGADDY